MALPVAPIAVALFLALLASLVLATRPASRANRAFFALLALQAGVTLAYAASRVAPDSVEAARSARLVAWYSLPYPMLVLALLAHLFPPLRPRPHLRALLVAGWVLTAAALLAMALAPRLFVAGARETAGGFFATTGGPLSYALTAATLLASGSAVFLAARAATSPARTASERRQAALLGLAFGFLAGHSGANYLLLVLDRALQGRASPLFALAATAGLVTLALVLASAKRLVGPFDGGARRLAWLAVLAPLALGVVDGILGPLSLRGVAPVPDYDNGILLRRAAFAALLALALVRHGLAGLGETGRRRVAHAAQAGLVAAAALLAVGGALAVLGVTTLGLVAAPILGFAALALSPLPARAAMDGIARRLLPDPADPAVLGERARVYTRALREALDRGDASDALPARLAPLRRELDLSLREHELLLSTLPRDAPATLALGRYHVERELGRGASATVLLARDPVAGRRVVLKRFHAKDVPQPALREARLLAEVRHDRIVRLLDIERVHDEVFLVLAFAEGGTARALLDREGPLQPAAALALVDDLLDALAALHAAGLVHRDVKLENVLLDAEGRALLGDLGSARFSRAPTRDLTLTGGAVLGTLATVAPEVLLGRPAIPASDTYAAGAVLYRLLTGEHYVAIEGIDVMGVHERILRDPPRLPHARVPAGLDAVLAKALAKRPEERFAGAPRMRAALAAWKKGEAPDARPGA